MYIVLFDGRRRASPLDIMVLLMLFKSRASAHVPSQTTRRLRSGLVTAGLAYAGATLAYAMIRPLLGTRQGWIELIDDLEPWAHLPSPALMAAGTMFGSGSLLAAGAALGAAFVGRWGHRYVRSAPAVSGAEADLTIMTFNTLAWVRSADDLAESITKANPDVVGLQEIGPNAVEHLRSALGDQYPHAYCTPSPTAAGAAVLSRYPLLDPVAFRASENGHWWQRMLVDAPGGPLTYINVHTKIPHIRRRSNGSGALVPLELDTERRSREVRQLVEMLNKIDGPIVVAGDFNMTERSRDHRLVATRLRDAYHAVGAGLGHTFPAWGRAPHTFPAPWPMLRLDYVWHSDHFVAAWAARGDAGKSDHHPIVVGLRRAAWAQESSYRLPLAASTL